MGQLDTIKETPNELVDQIEQIEKLSKDHKDTEIGEDEFKDVVPTTLFGNMLYETLRDD